MEDLYIIITDDQAQSVLPYIEEAEKQYLEKGERGAVFCQALRDNRQSPIRIVGKFIPEPYAIRISQILSEFKVHDNVRRKHEKML